MVEVRRALQLLQARFAAPTLYLENGGKTTTVDICWKPTKGVLEKWLWLRHKRMSFEWLHEKTTKHPKQKRPNFAHKVLSAAVLQSQVHGTSEPAS